MKPSRLRGLLIGLAAIFGIILGPKVQDAITAAASTIS